MDIHFNSYKVKYMKMDQMMSPIIRSKNIKTANIFINLDDIFHKLHRPQVNTEFQLAGEHAGKQVISNIMNVIAHYRQWAVRKGWETRVIGYYTSAYRGGFKNKLYVSKYRKKFIDINNPVTADYYFINQGIHDADKLFKVISQYIDKVYIIDSRFLEPSIIPYFFSTEVFSADWNIVISRDTYDMQYAYMDTWSFIYPKGDNTRIVDKSNIWDTIASFEKVKTYSNTYSPFLYPATICVVGDKYRNIPRIKRVGWATLFKILDRVSEYSDDKTQTTIQLLLFEELVGKTTTLEMIKNNLNAIDIPAQVKRMGEIDRADIHAQIIDVPDYENLMELNRLHFSKYPINLPFLTEQRSRSQSMRNPFGV